MLRLLFILMFMVPFASFSTIWEKADGPYKHVNLHKTFVFNGEVYSSESSTLGYVYKVNGDSWDKIDTGFFSDKGTVYHFDQKGDIIFASIGRKMYLSYDAGSSWKEIDTLDGQIRYSTVSIVDSTIFLQANQFFSLHRLEKGSDTLEKVYLSKNKIDSVFADIMISNEDYIFAADLQNHFIGPDSDGKLYISKDKGKTWNLSENMKEQIKSLHFHDNSLLAFTKNHKVHISSDYGETWRTDTSINMNVKKVISYKNKILACGSQVNISIDNGITWEVNKNNGLDYYQSCDDIFVNNDTLYYLSSPGIIFYSTDAGNQWNRNTPMTDEFAHRDIIETRDTLFSTGGFTFNYSTDNGESWGMYSDSLYYQYDFLNEITIKDSIFIIVNDWSRAFYISTDYGKSWKYENLGILTSQSWIRDIIIFDNRILLIGQYGNYISNDAGLTWKEYDNEVLGKDTVIYKYIRLNASDLVLYGEEGLYKTYDNGLSWEFEKTDTELVRNSYSYWDGNNIYRMKINTHQILKSTDLGRSWADLDLNIEPNLNWRHLLLYNRYLILLTTTDVFVSSSDGNDWRKYEVEILNPNGKNFSFANGIVSGNYMVLTSESGIWRAKLSDLGIVKSSVESEIEDNYLYTFLPYPNPATSEVKIRIFWDINLPMTTNDISVYDISGRKVLTKDNIRLEKQADHYGNIIWDCSSVIPGIYLINIKHGTEEKAVKVVVE